MQYLGRTLRKRGARICLLIVGVLSLAWFLFRSGPKPSRATYPCQRAALSMTHVALGAGALALTDPFWHRFGWRIRRSTQVRLLVTVLVIAGAGFFGSRIWSRVSDDLSNRRLDASWERRIVAMAGAPLALTSSVLGSSSLENPHRVAYVHDSDATDWDYASGRYWDHVDQTVVDGMFLKAMQMLTGSSTYAEAWSQLLPSYQPGQTIVIRVNFNNAFAYNDNDNTLDSNVQVVNAIVESLLEFGFPLGDISILETSRYVPLHFVNMLSHPVIVYDHHGHSATGNLVATFDSGDPSAAVDFTGAYPGPHKITDVLVDADYLVNVPIFQRHGGTGISLAMKNHLGTIDGLFYGSHSIHSYIYLGASYYAGSVNHPVVDINANEHIRDKAVLVVGDGLYGDWPNNNGVPHSWSSFGGDSPNAIFLGVDPVATDSVMYDFLRREGNFNAASRDYLIDAHGRGLGVHETCPFTAACQIIDYVAFDFDATGDPCDDGRCDPGDNCPALASTCSDEVCYEPTCENGCGLVEVPFGQHDEGCLAPSVCDGLGGCFDPSPSTPENLRRTDTDGYE